MKKNISFNIYTLGCKVNQYDSASLKVFLQEAGFVYDKEYYDLVIINSCAVTKIAIHKAQRIINQIKRKNKQAKIVLIGCWPRVYDDIKLDLDLIWSGKSEEWQKLTNEINRLFDLNNSKITETRKNAKFCVLTKNIKYCVSKTSLKPINNRKRYFIKIQDGCEQFCSYCIIPFSRGPLKSRKSKEVIEEIELAIKEGYREFVLSGIHLGLYGRDFKEGNYGLYDLLQELVLLKDLKSIQLSSIEVNELNDQIIKLTAKNNKIIPHFHIPLQSASNKILKLMNRPYNKQYFLKRVNKIKKIIPDVLISTDIIVGFPGENETDFLKTYVFAKNIKFNKIHVFSFSAHEKTPAYHLPDKNLDNIIRDRSKKLRFLSEKLENYKSKG